jgi:phage terminase large subunit
LGLYSYNPPPNSSHWANVEALDDRTPGRIRHHSTYLQLNPQWLGKKFLSDAEYLKIKNKKAYDNEYLGIVTGTGGEIFKNVKAVELTDKDILTFERIRQGLDFGFTVDPSSFIKLCYEKKHRRITLFNSYYDYEVPTRELAYQVNRICSVYEITKADSAEQRTIDTMKNEYGCNIEACKKGPDSVRHGIKFLQDLDEIRIDRKRCPDPYREFTTYQHEKNKEGRFIPKYPDENNHSIDATRYSLDDIILCPGWRVKTQERSVSR